jgi:hypothetical protein
MTLKIDRSEKIRGIVTDNQLGRLNFVFNILLELRRSKDTVGRLIRKATSLEPDALLAAARLRFKAAIFVNSVDQYFRLSVLNPAINLFDVAMNKASSIQDVMHAHAKLVDQVFLGCMQTPEYAVVNDCLWSIFEVCQAFADSLSTKDSNSDGESSVCTPDANKFRELTAKFDRRRSQFMSLLTAQSIVYGTERQAAVLLNYLNRLY